MIILFISCSSKHKNRLSDINSLPIDSASWDETKLSKYYSKILMTSLEDSIITLREAEIIDSQYGRILQTQSKRKYYTFIFFEATKAKQKPPTPG
jgi:hypothetical protein